MFHQTFPQEISFLLKIKVHNLSACLRLFPYLVQVCNFHMDLLNLKTFYNWPLRKVLWRDQRTPYRKGWIAHKLTYLQTSQWPIDLCLSIMFTIKDHCSTYYVPRFNSDGHLKSEVSLFQNLRFLNFQALDPKGAVALAHPWLRNCLKSSYSMRTLHRGI